MFLHGENGPQTFDDFRPEMHDSDGLMTACREVNGAGVRWSTAGPMARTTDYRTEGPRGFGLMQRDRQFASYLDVGDVREHQRQHVVEHGWSGRWCGPALRVSVAGGTPTTTSWPTGCRTVRWKPVTELDYR